MKTFILTLLTLALFMPVSACKAEEPQESAPEITYPTDTLVIESANTGEKHIFTVEVATTREQQMNGLMYRTSMPEDHGMIFLLPEEREHAFWMKNTLIPLDMVFIKSSGIINHIHENAIPEDETPVPSNGPVLSVLELNGGVTSKLGIKPGDIVYMSAGAR